jgi:DNA-binding CsgD family transcriptional regulator
LGVEDDLGLDVAVGDGGQICFCVQRKGWSFRPEERVVMDLLGPHVRLAWLQSERLKRNPHAGSWPESLERALGHGLIRLDESGRILEWTAQTRAQLERFTDTLRIRSHLPPPVLGWFREQVRRKKEKVLAERPPVVLTLERHPAVLDLQFVAESAAARYYLVTEERPLVPHPGLLRMLNLSAREQEVLFWLAQGKGNQVIAQILGISVHTVKRHLEKIYAKLSLDGRLAASCFAQEYLHRATRPE